MIKKSLLAVALIVLFGRQADGLVLAGYDGSHVLACSVGSVTNGGITKMMSRYFNPVTRAEVRDLSHGNSVPLISGVGQFRIAYERPFEARLFARESIRTEEVLLQRIDMRSEARLIASGSQPDGAHRFGDATIVTINSRSRAYQLDCNMMEIGEAERISAEDAVRIRRAAVLGAVVGSVVRQAPSVRR